MAAITICSDFGAQKSDTVSTVSLSISHELMGPDAMIFLVLINTVHIREKNNEMKINYLKYNIRYGQI